MCSWGLKELSHGILLKLKLAEDDASNKGKSPFLSLEGTKGLHKNPCLLFIWPLQLHCDAISEPQDPANHFQKIIVRNKL